MKICNVQFQVWYLALQWIKLRKNLLSRGEWFPLQFSSWSTSCQNPFLSDAIDSFSSLWKENSIVFKSMDTFLIFVSWNLIKACIYFKDGTKHRKNWNTRLLVRIVLPACQTAWWGLMQRLYFISHDTNEFNRQLCDEDYRNSGWLETRGNLRHFGSSI